MKKLYFIFSLIVSGCLGIAAQTPNCPELTVTGPNGVTQPGDTMTFTVEVKNFSGTNEVKYEWSVSAGAIEKGQGTSSIVIGTTQAMANSNVTATVRIPDIAAECRQSASEVASMAPTIGCGLSVDEFGKLTRDDVKARMDSFFIRLNDASDSEGLIAVFLKEEDTRTSKIIYLKNLYDAIIFRKYDPSRVTFMVSEEKGDFAPRTVLWSVPPGADFRDLGGDNPLIIKGEELKAKMKTVFLKK